MFFPYGTDAPIYHRPWSTVGIVVANIVVFGLALSGVIAASEYVLQFNDGLHPVQWVTSNFLHVSVGHLLGNMLFLWVFGQIVEGKLGWKKFLPCYLGIGALQCALEQSAALVFHLEGSSLGASAILFGLLAMALVWAPQNEIHIFYFFWLLAYVRTGSLSLTIRTVAFIYIGGEVLFALWDWMMDKGVTSSLLHLMGAAIGFPLAVMLLKRGVVDCEGWDIFSLRHGKPREIKLHRSEAVALPEKSREEMDEERVTALQLMEGYLSEGDPGLAAETYKDCVRATGPWELEEPMLRLLVKSFQDAKLLHEAKPYISECIERFPSSSTPMKLLLAKILIEHEQRPVSGLDAIDSISPSTTLTSEQMRVRQKLIDEANRLRDEGVLEME